jgi:hypothetical protein
MSGWGAGLKDHDGHCRQASPYFEYTLIIFMIIELNFLAPRANFGQFSVHELRFLCLLDLVNWETVRTTSAFLK